MDRSITGCNKNVANVRSLSFITLLEIQYLLFFQNNTSPDNWLFVQYMCLICIYM